jgi:hypothetical protein
VVLHGGDRGVRPESGKENETYTLWGIARQAFVPLVVAGWDVNTVLSAGTIGSVGALVALVIT